MTPCGTHDAYIGVPGGKALPRQVQVGVPAEGAVENAIAGRQPLQVGLDERIAAARRQGQ